MWVWKKHTCPKLKKNTQKVTKSHKSPPLNGNSDNFEVYGNKTSELKLPTKLIITNYNKNKIKVTEEYDYKFNMWKVGVKLKC